MRSPLFFPVALIIVLAFLVIAAGFLYYSQTSLQVKRTAGGVLEAVADLKVAIVSRWRENLLMDAEVLSANPVNALRLLPFLEKEPEKAAPDPLIQDWIDSIRTSWKFTTLILFDASGRPRAASGPPEMKIGTLGRENIARVLTERRPHLSDLQTAPEIGLGLHLDLYAPVFRSGEEEPSISGALMMRIDPADFLFPFLVQWPNPSGTAESFLIRSEAERVLVLSGLRHKPDAPLRFSLPAGPSAILRKMIAEGRHGPDEGPDYRGVRVLSVIRPIPGTPWFLVAQEDLSVILKPLLARISTFASMILILFFGIGTMLLFWIKRREARYFREHYETEHERLALVRHFEYLHKYANDVVFLTDRDHGLIEVNDRALSVYGYSREEFLGMHIPDLRPPDSRSNFSGQLQEAEKTGSLIFETLHCKKSGEIFPVEVSLRIIETGGNRFHQAIIRDISERKKAEGRIMDALREKEVLLREIHHRVKNNMQVISSLLRLQSAKFSDPEVREAFRESQGRIRSMALVHEKLYRTKDLSTIDFSNYIRTLTSTVFASHIVGERIALHLDLEKTSLDINSAVPCGLILNELVLNALKHAFPPGRSGRITIELRENEERMIRLTVRDDGVGIPDTVDLNTAESLGFQIVSLLAKQLEGRIDIRREAGTSMTLRFKPPRIDSGI